MAVIRWNKSLILLLLIVGLVILGSMVRLASQPVGDQSQSDDVPIAKNQRPPPPPILHTATVPPIVEDPAINAKRDAPIAAVNALPPSQVDCRSHAKLPGTLCEITSLVLRKDGTFVVTASPEVEYNLSPPTERLDRLAKVKFRIETASELPATCSQTIDDLALVASIAYRGGANNWHMHTDTLMAIFYMYERLNLLPIDALARPQALLIPAVVDSFDRHTHLPSVTWNTDAFKPRAGPIAPYWQTQLHALRGHVPPRPLTTSEWLDPLPPNGTVCFRRAIIGSIDQTPAGTQGGSAETGNEQNGFMERFSRFMRWSLGVHEPLLPAPHLKVGIVSRGGDTRLLLNEQELVDYIENTLKLKAELLHFETMAFAQQVDTMSSLTVLFGVNGAGLTNGFYLPPCATAVQIAPYDQKYLNIRNFGRLLTCRRKGGAPYIFWQNPHANLTQRHRVYSAEQSSTTMHLGDFGRIMRDAVRLAKEDCVIRKLPFPDV